MCIRDRDLTGALATYEEGLQISPYSSDLLLRKAQALEGQGRVDAARSAYEEALAINDELVVARNNLAILLTEHDGSEAAIQRAIELTRPFASSKVPALLDTLGWVYHHLGDSEQALSYLESALENSSKDPTMHFHLGMAHLKAGNSTSAKEALEVALNLDSTFAGAEEARKTLSSLL